LQTCSEIKANIKQIVTKHLRECKKLNTWEQKQFEVRVHIYYLHQIKKLWFSVVVSYTKARWRAILQCWNKQLDPRQKYEENLSKRDCDLPCPPSTVTMADHILVEVRFSAFIQTSPGTWPPSCTVRTGSHSLWGKAARVWSWPPTPTYCWG